METARDAPASAPLWQRIGPRPEDYVPRTTQSPLADLSWREIGGEASTRKHFPLNLRKGGTPVFVVSRVFARFSRSPGDLRSPGGLHLGLCVVKAREQLGG